MFNIIPWNENLNLDDFYTEAGRRGFDNNSSQKMMIDCLRNENEWNVWILFQDNKAIGSVAAHSFDNIMGPNSYRICVRTCILPHSRSYKSIITAKKAIAEHQNLTSQFFIPQCINWAGIKNNLYITSNEGHAGSQKLVHNIFFPTLAKKNIVTKIKDTFYRGINQTIWQIHPEKFLNDLELYPIWSLEQNHHQVD